MTKSCESYFAKIWIAGDFAAAKHVCRKFTKKVGACVTVTECDYIYTGGAESGVVVQFVNYPRFPKNPPEIDNLAVELAEMLRRKLYQDSYLIEFPRMTFWQSDRNE